MSCSARYSAKRRCSGSYSDVGDAQVVAVVVDRAGEVAALERTPERHLGGAAVQDLPPHWLYACHVLVPKCSNVGGDPGLGGVPRRKPATRPAARYPSAARSRRGRAATDARSGSSTAPASHRPPRVVRHRMVADRAVVRHTTSRSWPRRATSTSTADGSSSGGRPARRRTRSARGVPLGNRPSCEVSRAHEFPVSEESD